MPTGTLPAICRVVYDTEPPTLEPDDDPFIPYRFSFPKSYSSSNSFGRINGKGHSRYHGNDRRHVTDDAQESFSVRDVWRSSDKSESGRLSRRNYGERSEGYGVDLSRWIEEDDSLDVHPGPLFRCGMTAEEADEKLLESEEDWKRHPRRAARPLWDPITNTWISQDPNSLVYLHFANALSLADRGIHSNRTVLERRARLYPCMERHLKSINEVRRRMAGANASVIWTTQHHKRRASPSPQHRRGFLPSTKDFSSDVQKYRSGPSSNSSSSSTDAIRGSLITAKNDDDIEEKGRSEADEDSARGRSAATGSDEGQKPKDEEEEGEETAADKDEKSSSTAGNEDIEADFDDFISLDAHSGASDDNYSDVGRGDDWSGSGSTRTSLQQIGRVIVQSNIV